MSRSNPPSSPIVEKIRHDSSLAGTTADAGDRPFRRRVSIRLAALIRWLHIYLSMFGLAAVLLFSVTGLTLNHPDWFYGEVEHVVEVQGALKLDWIGHRSTTREVEPYDASVDDSVNRLEIVEYLRKTHHLRGALADFRVDADECSVTLKGPGYSADALIDRGTGKYRLTERTLGLIAILNDLHKGRDTGWVWSCLIDVSAILMTLISLTGLFLIFYLKRRRLRGLAVSVVGAAIVFALAYTLSL